MAYFPFFSEIKDVPALLVGGGLVALRKAEKLLPYGPQLTVIAPEIRPEIEALPGVKCLRRPFLFTDLETASFVIACTDQRALNHEIAARCRACRIPVNVVDDPQACSFYFPALVKRGSLSIGISTGGASPPAAKWLKERIAQVLPEGIEAILAQMETLRPQIKARVPQQAVRARILQAVLAAALEKNAPLSEAEIQQIQREESGQ